MLNESTNECVQHKIVFFKNQGRSDYLITFVNASAAWQSYSR